MMVDTREKDDTGIVIWSAPGKMENMAPLNRVVREGLLGQVMFEARPAGSGESIPSMRNRGVKALVVLSLCSKYSKEARK
jgi:hypothetical protein